METEAPSAFPVECNSAVQRDGKLGVAKILYTCFVTSLDTLKKKVVHILSAGKVALLISETSYIKACGEMSGNAVYA